MPLPRQQLDGSLDDRWRLGAVGGAAALALATVLALAAVVAGLAATLAGTVVLAFTGVLGGVLSGVAQAGLGRGHLVSRAVVGRLGRYGGSTDQAGESRRQKQCIHTRKW